MAVGTRMVDQKKPTTTKNEKHSLTANTKIGKKTTRWGRHRLSVKSTTAKSAMIMNWKMHTYASSHRISPSNELNLC